MNSKLACRIIPVILALVALTGCAVPSATSVPTPQPGESAVFKLVKTVQVTPDDVFANGSLGYIPATSRFVVMVTVTFDRPLKLPSLPGECGKAMAYKEYTTDMQPTGRYGYIACVPADGTT